MDVSDNPEPIMLSIIPYPKFMPIILNLFQAIITYYTYMYIIL